MNTKSKIRKFLNGFLTLIVNLCRFSLSAVLLVSGFVKALDPIGMGYKINAYLHNWGFLFSDESVVILILAIGLSAIEFLLGIYLFLGIRRKLTTITTTLLICFLTVVTIYIYKTNAVPDCGCFGDAITLTNEQTMYKNFILFALCLPTLFFPQRMFRLITKRNQWITSMYAFVYIVVLGIYSVYYLPVIDFMAYKTGTDLKAIRTNPDDKMIEKVGEKHFGEILNLAFFDGEEDVTDNILLQDKYTFLLISPRLEEADDGVADRINDLKDISDDKGYLLYCVTASDTAAINLWKDHTGAAYKFLMGQEEQLKSIVRSNPGLVLLKNGKILNKWSKNTLPLGTNSKFDVKNLPTTEADLKEKLLKLGLWFFIPLFLIIFADVLWNGAKHLYDYNKQRLIDKYLGKKREW